jgi:hypothetical protein
MFGTGGCVIMEFRVRLQLAESFGPINRWFCSEFYGREVNDPELLVRYYVKSGGAANFARRYAEAMGKVNRWYCSEFHGRDIRDPQILWEYYVNHAPVPALDKNPRYEPNPSPTELCFAS